MMIKSKSKIQLCRALKASFALLIFFQFTFLLVPKLEAEKNPGAIKRSESITLSTYYPSPFGAYNELKAKKFLPLYDSGWIKFPLIKRPDKRKLHFLELKHNLETVDTVVQIETKIMSRRSVRDFKKAYGYMPLSHSPIIYNIMHLEVVNRVLPAMHVPTYTKDADKIIVTMEPLSKLEKPIEFLIRVVMWGY